MIERNLRYVSLRRYGTAFLDAFGFYPLDYFGAKGDNLSDNYANIQVAVDETIKAGLKYIFVPDGTYYYNGVILNVDKVIFVGNAEHAKIYNQNHEELKIYQIGTQLPYEKDTVNVSKEVTETGYIDIEVRTKNPSEAILVIDNDVFYITDTLILLNGSLYQENVTLATDVTLSNIELVKNAIRLHYTVENAGGTISKQIEWRVR